MNESSSQRALLIAATLAYVAMVLILTLSPMPWATNGAQPPAGVLNPVTWLTPGTWTAGSPREFALNVILFIPAGLLAARLRAPWDLAAPPLLALAVEIVQIALPDRISDPRDLVANTLGGLVGMLVVLIVRRGRLRRAS